jgi:hypothetical protein
MAFGVSKPGLRDRIRAWCSPAPLRTLIVAMTTVVQDDPPEYQLLAPATLLVVYAEALGMDPHDLVTQVQRAKSHVSGPFSNEWRAMEAYAKGELS